MEKNTLSPNDDKMITLRPDIISDEFWCEDIKVAVLENKAFKNIDDNILILAKKVETDDGIVLEALNDAEYKKATKIYNTLIKLMQEDDIDE